MEDNEKIRYFEAEQIGTHWMLKINNYGCDIGQMGHAKIFDSLEELTEYLKDNV